MKKLLPVLIILIFIATSCKKKTDSENENVTELIETKIDTEKTQIVEKKREKVIPEYSTVEKPKISKADYLNFFKDVLRTDGMIVNKPIKIFPMESKYWNADLMRLTEKDKDSSLSELIDKNDISFIYEQTELQKGIVLKPKNIPRKKIERKYLDDLLEKVDLETYWNEIYKMGSGYYSIELPLFSIDKKIAFFRYSYSCGSLCANSGTYIYKKINGKWEWIGGIGPEIVS
ncbi:hypothetical protein [Polaribacter cellanae]|uniref:Lipoprotein n=1 Tax=Polaribacter cellanae TaxID=2818493 RepID=A0A975H861_9FLAO|nr:hypothetical protein [Polaribacter cellanae]QTE24226.1 hypothetical protein J3359_08175 [Polaribacter cellanae]